MKKVILAIMFFYSAFSNASESGPATNVEYIYSRADANAPYIRFGSGAMPGCHGNNGGYLSLADEKGTERTYSLLLSAYVSKQTVKVYYTLNDVPADYAGWGLCTINAVSLE